MLCWQCNTIWNHSNNPVCARIVSVPITLITSAYHEYHGMISGVCLDAIQTLVTAPIQITAIQTHATSSSPFLPRLPAGAFSCALFRVGQNLLYCFSELFRNLFLECFSFCQWDCIRSIPAGQQAIYFCRHGNVFFVCPTHVLFFGSHSYFLFSSDVISLNL